MRDLIVKAQKNGKITKPQANALLRHAKHHSQGHLLWMLRAMVEKSLSFQEAHARAMKAVGK